MTKIFFVLHLCHCLVTERARLSSQRRSFVRLRRLNSTLGPCQSWPRRWRTTARSWSAVATTGSCSAGSRPLTVTATWCWRMSRRCGLSCLREPRERARSPLTRTASSARCSSEETPWSSCSETRLERQLWTWMEMSKIKRQVVCSFLFFFFLFFFLFFFSIYLSECSLHWECGFCFLRMLTFLLCLGCFLLVEDHEYHELERRTNTTLLRENESKKWGCKAWPVEGVLRTQRRDRVQFADSNPHRISKHGSWGERREREIFSLYSEDKKAEWSLHQEEVDSTGIRSEPPRGHVQIWNCQAQREQRLCIGRG